MSFVNKNGIVQNYYERIRVKSSIFLGEHFLEYRYQPYSEDFVGTWRKVGGKFGENPSTTSLQCEFCVSHSESWPKQKGISKPVSYQCLGWTKPFNKYEWSVGKCSSNSSCWGPSEYFLEVKMMHSFQFQFTHKKIANPNVPGEEVIARYNCSILRKYSPIQDRPFLHGISLTTRKLKMFYPSIINSEHCGENYYIYINMYPNDKLPPHMKYLYDVSMSSWPSYFQDGAYQFPNHLNMEYFRETPGLEMPSTIGDLENHHTLVGLTFLELYPGGGGMKCTQYKYLSNQNFSSEESERQEQVLRSWHDKRRNHLLVDNEPDITEPTWLNNFHVYKKDAFIPGIKDGLAGPIISYWARLDNNRRWFAAPVLQQTN